MVDILEVNPARCSIQWHLPIAIYVDNQSLFAHDVENMECNTRDKMTFNAFGHHAIASIPFLVLKWKNSN